MRHGRGRAAVALSAAVLAGCTWDGSGRLDPDATLPDPSTWPIEASEGGPCADDADCAAGFMLGEIFYSLSCGTINPQLVTDQQVGTQVSTAYFSDGSAYVIEGVDPNVVLAVPATHRGCGNDPDQWQFSSNWTSDDAEIREIMCEVVVDVAVDDC